MREEQDSTRLPSFGDRDMVMRYRGGGIGHQSTRSCDALLSRDGPASRLEVGAMEQIPEEEAGAGEDPSEDSGEDSGVILEEESDDDSEADGEADGEAGGQVSAGPEGPVEPRGEGDGCGSDEDVPLDRVYEENVYDAPGSDEEEEGSGDEDEDVWDKAGFAAP